jgi:hypothetical protein
MNNKGSPHEKYNFLKVKIILFLLNAASSVAILGLIPRVHLASLVILLPK